jgi:excisionase family DNA binding protein
MVQYYTLEQAAKVLRIDPEQLKEMARKKEIRAFQDRSGWRFRAQEIEELARERGYGSDPELPLGEAAKAKPGDSGGGGEVFNFSLEPDDSEVALGKEPVSTEKPSSRPGPKSPRPAGSKSPPPKASSDSDVRLVLEGSDLDFSIDPAENKAPAAKGPVSPPPSKGPVSPPPSKGPVSPAPKAGSSKSRGVPPVQDDSGVRIVPLDQPSDSDVKIVPASPHDSDVPAQSAKKKSDSDIRVEEMGKKKEQDQLVTEEIDLDAEERKAAEARAKASQKKPKPASAPILPTTSPFELSEHDVKKDPSPIPRARARKEAVDESDSSSDFELKPMADSSSPLEVGSDELAAMQSDDEVGLGELTAGKGASGINLQDPADSGISLEQRGSSDEMQLDMSLDSDKEAATPTPAEKEIDSSSDFELSVPEESSSPTEGSSSDFELSLQEDDASPTEGSSSEFELSLDADAGDLVVDEGSSDLALEAPSTDSDSEFELTLDESGGLSVEEEGAAQGEDSVFETDFEVPSMDEESGSEAVALDDTGLESSEFDLSVEGEESGSQVVPLEDEEEYDEGAATVQRKRRPAAAAGGELEDLGEALDEDLDEQPSLEEEEAEGVGVAAAPEAPADWGIVVPVASLFSTLILFLVSLMSFELIHGMWGYHTGNTVTSPIVRFFAKTFSGEDNLPDN